MCSEGLPCVCSLGPWLAAGSLVVPLLAAGFFAAKLGLLLGEGTNTGLGESSAGLEAALGVGIRLGLTDAGLCP